MEVVGNEVALAAVRLVLDLAKSVRRRCRHGARLTAGRVVQDDLQAVGRVVLGDGDVVALAHEQVRRRIRRVSGVVRLEWVGG